MSSRGAFIMNLYYITLSNFKAFTKMYLYPTWYVLDSHKLDFLGDVIMNKIPLTNIKYAVSVTYLFN